MTVNDALTLDAITKVAPASNPLHRSRQSFWLRFLAALVSGPRNW
jgi:hypothetical protein